MFALICIIVLMVGATIGFVLACVIAARRVAYLSREGQLLLEELEQYRNLFGLDVNQNEVNTTPLFLQVEFPHAQD